MNSGNFRLTLPTAWQIKSDTSTRSVALLENCCFVIGKNEKICT